ncbi:MAG: cytochrome b/b6 domain-containing protein [Devosia sp.]
MTPQAAFEPAPTDARHYDSTSIALHWLTALLVILLFGTAIVWQRAPRNLNWGDPLQSLHISLGIVLAAVLVARLAWRLSAGRKLPAAERGIMQVLAQLVHVLLYVLLAAQVGLGFLLRWVQGEEFAFFGLFSIPALISANRGLERTVENLHNISAWAIIYLAGAHAAAALFHHYWRHDGVLARMLPGLRSRGA